MNWIDRDDCTADCAGLDAPQLAVALEAYQEALRMGKAVDRNAFLSEHAAIADQLAVCLDALELIQSVADDSPATRDTGINQSPLESGDILGNKSPQAPLRLFR